MRFWPSWLFQQLFKSVSGEPYWMRLILYAILLAHFCLELWALSCSC